MRKWLVNKICCKQIVVDLLYYSINRLLVRKVKGCLPERRGINTRKLRESILYLHFYLIFSSGDYSTPKYKRKGAFLLLFLGLQRY